MSIRNFCILAHIDHGKSTLADRMLELTATVEKRAMHPQYLDQMAIEQERGITIKMQPVRMQWTPTDADVTRTNAEQSRVVSREVSPGSAQVEPHVLNLIDTPGHVDFSYEVSRALAAVEGAVVLVDATKGVQAQTIANLDAAKREGLVIIPAVNKIDLPQARPDEAASEIAALLGIAPELVHRVSAKDGTGVSSLLDAIVREVPEPPGVVRAPLRALIFDSHFDAFRGVVAHIRVVDGTLVPRTRINMMAKNAKAEVLELGYFVPQEKQSEKLSSGEIGWLATGIKEPDSVRVGDTIITQESGAESQKLVPLPGYREPQPVVYASLFPETEDEFEKLRDALKRLKLNDAAFDFEPEQSQALGRGFRCGFLGLLHMDIVMERLRREFASSVIATSPSVRFVVKLQNGQEKAVQTAKDFPDPGHIREIHEPWAHMQILVPAQHFNAVLRVLGTTRAVVGETTTLSAAHMEVQAEAPMVDIIQNFADRLKSATQGYASFSWMPTEYRAGDLVRFDIFVAHELQEAFSRVLPRMYAEREGRELVLQLKEIIPKQLFAVALQAAIDGKIIARETIPAMRKDVTGYLYGGDYSRKRKLLEKQKRGKKRMGKTGRVHIPPEVFQKVLRRAT